MMDSNENDWAFSPIEVCLAFMFIAVVFVAYRQDNSTNQNTKTAYAQINNNSNAITQNETESNAMNKVDSLFHYLEERAGEGTDVPSPALTTDQKRFFHQVLEHAQLRKQNYHFSDMDKKRLLRAASITYAELETITKSFNNVDMEKADWSAIDGTTFFQDIENRFGVSQEACKLFASQAPNTLGDWAFFLEKQME